MATLLTAPPGVTEQHIDGTVIRPSADGTASCPDRLVHDLMQAGWTKPQNQIPNVTTAGRPTVGLRAGDELFDTTLGKPIWRNKTNTGWVDATGTAA